jgi:murein L,D-transpeptidase YcbB/YkuD
MVRKRQRPDRQELLNSFRGSSPEAFLRSLAPATPQYTALMKEKIRLEGLIASGGWGPSVPGSRKLEPGDSGPSVIALRNRLIAMGYLDRSASPDFDILLEDAVRRFQSAHGLEADGVAGKGTLAEINKPAEARLKSVIVAMERERWLTPDRGERHVLVNQTDFTAKIVDRGAVTFETRSVIGKNVHDRRSPEFSDIMEHMIINPSWHVPRSIATKEYLPQLKQNPHAQGQLEITDSRGRRVNRNEVDFTQFTARTFPFAMRQPPSRSNALGLVKFMFPNKYNIYLHDTPQKHLFAREVRAYSHGCIRLAQPFEFAYALLAKQTENPKDFFHRILSSGKETKVDLEVKVPVHIIYRTAFVGDKGQAEYRRDIYGRDAKVWAALEAAGVALPGVQG